MPDGTFHTGWCRCVCLCNRRIELLRDGIEDIHILYCHQDRAAQILVSLDMCWHAYLMNDFRNLYFELCLQFFSCILRLADTHPRLFATR